MILDLQSAIVATIDSPVTGVRPYSCTQSKWLETRLRGKVVLTVVHPLLRDGVDGMGRAYAILLVEYLLTLAVGAYSPYIATRGAPLGFRAGQSPFVLSTAQARQHVAAMVRVGMPSYGLAVGGNSCSASSLPLPSCTVTGRGGAAGGRRATIAITYLLGLSLMPPRFDMSWPQQRMYRISPFRLKRLSSACMDR